MNFRSNCSFKDKYAFKNNYFTCFKNHKEIKIFISKKGFEKIPEFAFEQLESISEIKEIVSPIIGLPDISPGYSVPIGVVFLTDAVNGVVCPSAIGYDINCGVRLIKTNLYLKDVKDKLSLLATALNKLPLGLSKNGYNISNKDLNDILTTGVNWCVKKKICSKDVISKIDNKGCYSNADSSAVSIGAKKLGLLELGTLGEGNHFIDVLIVNDVFNKPLCKKYGLEKNQVVILIHSGSRGLGHQVATDYIDQFEKKIPFANALITSAIGEKYLSGMFAAGNYAFVNREVISMLIKGVFENVIYLGHPKNSLSKTKLKFELIYDLCHNIATFEKINGVNYLVTRKGATRVDKGVPIILPGSMSDYSCLLVPGKSIAETSFSIAHGLGRSLSRTVAKEQIIFNDLKKQMEKKGIILAGRSERVMREEQPLAYKPSKEIITYIEKAKLAKRVANFKPIIVLTG